MDECLSCKSLTGQQRISPGEVIYSGEYWQLEHGYPTRVLGWLVVVLKRHAAALHELTPAEFLELSFILEKTTKVLKELMQCEKEYVACYAEKEGYQHIHVHIIPRAPNLSIELIGSKIFSLMVEPENEPETRQAIATLCQLFRKRLGH